MRRERPYGYVIADAVMTEPAGAAPQPFRVTWPLNAATGEYAVFARWASHANRANDAEYTVRHQSGETTLTVDQRQGGDTWQSLGHFQLDPLSEVSVNTDANGYVIADAVRILGAPQGNSATSTYLRTLTSPIRGQADGRSQAGGLGCRPASVLGNSPRYSADRDASAFSGAIVMMRNLAFTTTTSGTRIRAWGGTSSPIRLGSLEG